MWWPFQDDDEVFITGSAGTGKTFLLNHIIKLLRKQYKPSQVFVTGSTGVVACAIRGQTLHSFAGDDSSWGGIQLVVSGDFFQLPPVKSKRIGDGDNDKQFAFEADCWDSSFALQVELTKVYRQSDPQFIKFLQNIRIGKLGEEEEEYFKRLQSSATMDSKAMLAVQVYPMNKDVSRVNEERMKSLGDEAFVFKAIDSGSDIKRCRKQLDQATPSELSLCLGARDGLLPVVKFDSGKTKVIEPVTWQVKDGDNIVAERKQLPLTLAWATSIHKCQGKTIDFIKADLSNAFEYGMHYVVMSRAKSPEGLFVTGLDPAKIKAHPKVLRFHEKKLASEKDEKSEEDSTTAPLAVSHTKFHFSLSEFLQNRP
uniref:ATP-dependent DNA helicase n=1 Tax=Cannabis sativa TaxID=3483 RepID=A0A803QLP6_CANSA